MYSIYSIKYIVYIVQGDFFYWSWVILCQTTEKNMIFLNFDKKSKVLDI